MAYSPETAKATRDEWRELGFYYQFDDEANEWQLTGSNAGLQQFVRLLREYVEDPRHAEQAEHEHYGPYFYLKVMTWPDAGITANAIHGPLSRLEALAVLIGEKLSRCHEGESFAIGDEFAPECEAKLCFILREDSFGPASMDRQLSGSAV